MRVTIKDGVVLSVDASVDVAGEESDFSRVVERSTRCKVASDCMRIVRQGLSDCVASVRNGGVQYADQAGGSCQ